MRKHSYVKLENRMAKVTLPWLEESPKDLMMSIVQVVFMII